MDFFVLSQKCIDLGLRAGAVILRDVRISDACPELRAEITREIQSIRSQFESAAQLRSLPELQVLYKIFKAVGVKPRRQPPSIERLLQYALKRGDLPAINSFVDAYNLMSIRTRCSMGAHDLDLLSPPVELRLLRGDESFIPLGGTGKKETTPGEFGYVDGKNNLLCRLDVVQADFSKVTTDTKNVLLIIEGTTAYSRESLEKIFAETAAIVQRYCGGTTEVVAFPHWGHPSYFNI